MITVFKNKKGTEKPIEIFVALFIILAVAMVILKMFSAQIASKQQQIGELEQSQRLAQERQEATQFCNERCVEASAGDCSIERQAAYCLANVKSGLDLNGDGDTSDYDETLLAGIGVCEDKVYCPQLVSCTCRQKLSMNNCKQILSTYWEQQGRDATQLLSKKITPGACYDDLSQEEKEGMWCWGSNFNNCS